MTVISDALADLSGDERAAVWMIRYFAGPGRPCCRLGTGTLGGLFFRKDLDALGDSFRHALDRCAGMGVQLLDVRTRGCDAVSLTELLLLDATALAQSGDEKQMRATLHRVFVQHHVVSSFAAVTVQLAACLASAGYWLLSRTCVRVDRLAESQAIPDPIRETRRNRAETRSVRPVAAASLATMSRWRGHDMGLAQVLWPVPGGIGVPA
ncbi:hypothetical protein [Acetobacter conturbans]|uniref:Uncharacterized protein n=1 Tax=Acetobacter conturbans TaxID=1737472 RepID=A0ABX0K536_9PROT|nr:hypothetical protein [Acetobacter conturbans]NHN89725.1 hypothetical protein [Acetobacter conturbans]